MARYAGKSIALAGRIEFRQVKNQVRGMHL